MRRSTILCLAIGVFVSINTLAIAQTPLGSSFTYQGVLRLDGVPVNGLTRIEYSLWDAESGGNQIGFGLGTVTDVVDGVVTLNLNFGPEAFNGDARWLQIGVANPPGSGIVTLTPRQEIKATPYALQTRGIYVDDSGNVGINTIAPMSQLTVAGAIECTAGGFTFPDGTTQMTAAVANGDGHSLDTPDGALSDVVSVDNAGHVHAGIGDTTLLDQQVAETGATRNNTSGQLFTAGLTGNLIAVELYRPAGAPAGTIEILDSLLPTAQPIASAPIGASAAEGWVYVELDPAPPIVRESSYAILLDEGGWNFDNSNPYDAGSSIHSPAVDMCFRTYASEAAANLHVTVDGVGINTDEPQAALHIAGVPGLDGIMYPDGTIQTTALSGGVPGWGLNGNAGTVNGQFIGTTDSQRFDIRVNNRRIARFQTRNRILLGDQSNSISDTVNDSVIGGGASNTISGYSATISGGEFNDIISAGAATIGGGLLNTVLDAPHAVIAGGYENHIEASTSFVGGGYVNRIESGAFNSVIGGGVQNVVNGEAAVVPGGRENMAAGNLSFAAGNHAHALHHGTFVWSDFSSDNTFESTGDNQFLIRATGGVGIGRAPTANALELEGDASKSTAGAWLANSDRRIKTDIETVTGALDTLDKVRLVSFEYTDEYQRTHTGVGTVRYLNVIAQEFAEVFPNHVKSSGEKLPDGSEILQVDTYPLTIYSAAAIQELRRETREQLAEKDKQIKALNERIVKLEMLISASARN